MDLYAAPPAKDVLFEVTFEASIAEEEQKGLLTPGEITTFRGHKNRVLMGVPQTIDIVDSWPANESLAPEIAAFKGRWDFYSVRMACSFVPDRSCRFAWARLGVELIMRDDYSLDEPTVLAFDLFPREILRMQTYKRSFSVTPSFKFAFASAELAVDHSSELLTYQPATASSGLLTDTPAWTFTPPAQSGLSGDRELFLLVKKPKGESVEATFTIGAEVRTALGPVQVRRYGDDDLMKRTYKLLPGR